MPDLLLELFSEEIPARMQSQAARDLQKLVTDALVETGILYEGAASYVTPRRLALHIVGLPARQPDQREEKKGPRVGALEAAIQGFLKSAGLTSLEQAQIVSDGKKGEFYVAHIERKGQPTQNVLAQILPAIVRNFPWPKSMRWGAASHGSDSLRWVRPLHGIVASFGAEGEDPVVIDCDIDGIKAGNITYGHRFMAPEAIKVKRFDDYVSALEKAKVVLDPARRRDIILHDARDLAFAQGLELIEDEALLAEVAGLVEWPVVLMGEFDAAFLDIPAEVIRATIRANQKCFVLRDPKLGALANKFLLVSNIIARDGGKKIIAGNERVVRARLSDALYFWQTDQKPLPDYADKAAKPLDQRLAKLCALNIVFHEKLGTQGERVERIITLARFIAQQIGADADKAARAAELCKADLMSEVVCEFPEVQGLMGRRYALLQGEPEDVAIALEDHYKPQGPSDRVPTHKVAIAVALADKIDTLVGFWAINEKPTGSKDPYALRRAALGVIRIVLENDVRVKYNHIMQLSLAQILVNEHFKKESENKNEILSFTDDPERRSYRTILEFLSSKPINESNEQIQEEFRKFNFIIPDLLAFIHERLKVYLRDKGARHDLIDAVLAQGDNDDLRLIVSRVEALASLLESDDGQNLLAGYKKTNIVANLEPTFDNEEFEKRLVTIGDLAIKLHSANVSISSTSFNVDMTESFKKLTSLNQPLFDFMEHVRIEEGDEDSRNVKRQLIIETRKSFSCVGDLSKIKG